MPVGNTTSVAVVGLEPVAVTVEANVGGGLPAFQVIGSSGKSAAESAYRVKVALQTLGLADLNLNQKVLLALAPADIPKAGARFDLAMAVSVLLAQGLVSPSAVERTALLGELALDGQVRPVPGVLPSTSRLLTWGIDTLIVATGNASEAAVAEGVRVVSVESLVDLVAVLEGDTEAVVAGTPAAASARPLPDIGDVRGQHEARRALELAAAGGHHVLLVGPPGCGKSMLASRLPSLLPSLDNAVAMEVASIRSVAGTVDPDRVLDHAPPFVAPHHTASPAALIGGGSGVARPGALSRAHRGVLFLDELFEWPRHLLESLREPLEEGVVRIARAEATVTYPSRVQLICAANPCPCGGGFTCGCGDEDVWRYRAKLSGPVADRLDLAPHVDPLTADDLLTAERGEPSAVVAARVARARVLASERWGECVPNAQAPIDQVRRTSSPAALRTLAVAVERGELTGRGFDRALRVARTCADLAGSETVQKEHTLEARAQRLNLRPIGEPMGLVS